MRTLAILSVVVALASAAEYSAADPPPSPSYVAEKEPIPPVPASFLALIAKLLEVLKAYDYSPASPAVYGDAVLPDQTYAEPDFLSLLKLVVPEKPKYAAKTTIKILDRVPGVYGSLPAYALPPALLNAAYAKPAPLGLGLVPPYAPHPANFVYPPAIPAYQLPLLPAPKLPLSPAVANGYPGYAPPALGLPGAPLIAILKELLEILKAGGYGAAPAAEAVEYIPKPKKPIVKAVVAAKKAPGYVKPGKVPAKAYAAPAIVAPAAKVVKADAYPKRIKVEAPVAVPKISYPAKVVTAEAAIPVDYAVDAAVPAAVAPTYTPAVTVAPVDLYPGVEARSASGGESQASTIAKKVFPTVPSSTDGGESARASLSDHSISLEKTISRVS